MAMERSRRSVLGMSGLGLLATATEGRAGPARSYRRIATEEAFITPDLARESKKLLASGQVEPGFAKLGSFIFGDSFGARLLHGRLVDIGAARIAQMDADGIDLAVLSITSPGVQVFDADLGQGLATDANDRLIDAVRSHPTRLAGLAAVAPQAPDMAARELERTKAAGLKGFLINSHTHGEYLDAPKFAPIFEAAQALDLPLYLHPREPGPTSIGPYLDYGLYFASWGFAAETALHAMRLIMSGLFDRYPKVRVVLGHMGEGLPFWLDRIDNRYKAQVLGGVSKPLKRLPSDYVRQNFDITTSGMMSGPPLRLAIDTLGIDRIQFAGDYPYEDVAAGVKFIETAQITPDERRAIFETNAVRYWNL